MTRGSIYLITNEKLYGSTEFNWDMYPSGYWNEVIKMLEKVSNLKEFQSEIANFNSKNHNYQNEQLIYDYNLDILEKYRNFNYKYFDIDEEFCWFSDWIFIKNISDIPYTFILRNEKNSTKTKEYVLEPWEIVRFNFWSIAEVDKDKFITKR